jgi:hypothetical protein
MAKDRTVVLDLVIDNGELVRIKGPGKYDDEIYESIENAMKRREWWSARQWDGCEATYMGLFLDCVNMARVVGRM